MLSTGMLNKMSGKERKLNLQNARRKENIRQFSWDWTTAKKCLIKEDRANHLEVAFLEDIKVNQLKQIDTFTSETTQNKIITEENTNINRRSNNNNGNFRNQSNNNAN